MAQAGGGPGKRDLPKDDPPSTNAKEEAVMKPPPPPPASVISTTPLYIKAREANMSPEPAPAPPASNMEVAVIPPQAVEPSARPRDSSSNNWRKHREPGPNHSEATRKNSTTATPTHSQQGKNTATEPSRPTTRDRWSSWADPLTSRFRRPTQEDSHRNRMASPQPNPRPPFNKRRNQN